MRTIIPGRDPIQVVRDDEYIIDFNGFGRSRRLDVVLGARQMEMDILLTGGYPSGSYPAMRRLVQIEESTWQLVINLMEFKQNGTARKALEFVERLRVYERNGE